MRGARTAGLTLLAALVGATAAGCRAAPAAHEAEGAAFFAGRTIDYIVAYAPGGGYDGYARLVARHMERHLPGARIAVRNVPGAMNLIAANEVYAAEPDGLTIGTFSPGLIYPQLVGEPGVRFDLGRMSWIGRVAAEPRVLAVGTRSGIQSIEDFRRPARPIRLATGSVGNSGYFAMHIVKEALGLEVEIVPGFDENEAELAMLRGDLAGYIASPVGFRMLTQQGLGRFILRMGHGEGVGVEDTVPAAEDLAVSAFGRTLLTLVAVQADLSRPTAAPPGVPPDRLNALRLAYTAALTDPALIAEAAKMQLPIDPLDGAEVAARITHALAQPPDVVDWLRRLVRR